MLVGKVLFGSVLQSYLATLHTHTLASARARAYRSCMLGVELRRLDRKRGVEPGLLTIVCTMRGTMLITTEGKVMSGGEGWTCLCVELKDTCDL